MIRNWIEAIKNSISGLPELPIVHSERFNDPVALICGWRCLKPDSANFTTHKLLQKEDKSLVYISAGLLKIFGIIFVIGGSAIFFAYFTVINRHWIMLVFGPLLMISGAVVIIQSILPVGFDSKNRLFYRGWRVKAREAVLNRKNAIPFNRIHAIQLITKVGRTSSSSENYHEDHCFYAYELNLVLHDGTRKYVMTYVNSNQALVDANHISELVKAPVWNAMVSRYN